MPFDPNNNASSRDIEQCCDSMWYEYCVCLNMTFVNILFFFLLKFRSILPGAIHGVFSRLSYF